MRALGKYFLACLSMALVAASTCVAQAHQGIVLDASTNYIVVSGGMTPANIAAGKRDPRIMQLLRRHAAFEELHPPTSVIPTIAGDLDILGDSVASPASMKIDGANTQLAANRKIDWSVNLGAGNLAPHQFAAKYGFNPNAQPDCTNDYVVYGLNVAGVTNGQANLVGINELYSGTNGLCGTTPHINWAYNGSTAAGAILGSTTLSLDGTKVAYVESASSSSILHVLTWKAGQGTSALHSASPTQVGHCTATSSCLTSLTYSATSPTIEDGVYVNYATDKGYISSNDGNIYQISCVFLCALNANPTIDWTFTLPVAGTGGTLPVPGFAVYSAGYVFVADQLGEVWSINASGSTPVLAGGPVMVGGGGCTTANPPGRTGTPSPCTANGGSYGVAGPVIDSTGGKIYAYSGNDGTSGASAVVVQMNSPDLTGAIVDNIGLGSVGNTTTNVNLDIGAFDNNYEYGTPTQGHLFLCGTGTSDTTPYHYWIGFANYPSMNSQPTLGPQRVAIAGAPCTAYTELYNPNLTLIMGTNDHDLLMSGVIDPTQGAVITSDISNGSITPLNFVLYPGGTSNIIIDNTSDDPQASSLYFSTLAVVSVGSCSNSRCAVKLSQLDLQ